MNDIALFKYQIVFWELTRKCIDHEAAYFTDMCSIEFSIKGQDYHSGTDN